MKVTVIGGGSTYTPELVKGFLERAETFPLSELWLMDIDKNRLDIVGGFAQRMVKAANTPFRVVLTTNQQEAIAGARYVTTQFRVGGMAARREDEYWGHQFSLIGQETTGVGGMAKALRTIPVLLNIANDIKTLAPSAMLVNFTNPAGLVTEALARHAPKVVSVGVCNVSITAKMRMLDLLEFEAATFDPARAHLDTLGINHLSWHRGFTIDGEDVWPQIMAAATAAAKAEPDTARWDAATLTALQMIPNYYLQYFYDTQQKIADQNEWPPSRAEQVMQIDADLLRQYAEPDRHAPPEGLLQRGGAYYSTLATQLLNAHHNDLKEVHVLNVPHRGAVADYPADWVLELPCRVSQRGIEPLPAEPLPAVAGGLLMQVKQFELLVVKAAVFGDRQAAYQALLAHPLGPPAKQAEAVLTAMLQKNRDHLPQFFTE